MCIRAHGHVVDTLFSVIMMKNALVIVIHVNAAIKEVVTVEDTPLLRKNFMEINDSVTLNEICIRSNFTSSSYSTPV